MYQVLLVEDDPLNRLVIEDVFRKDGMRAELTSVKSGEKALAVAPKLQPDLILMDIELPGVNGLDVVRQLRTIPKMANTAIWAVTAHAMKREEIRALEAGCDTFISKPLELQDIHKRLRTIIDGGQEMHCHENYKT